MDRSALNAVALGTGGASHYLTLSATQALSLVGIASMRIIKRLSAAGVFSLQMVANLSPRVKLAAVQTLSLVGAPTIHALHKVYFSATRALSVGSVARMGAKIGLTGEATLALDSVATLSKLVPVQFSGAATLRMTTSANLLDLYSGPADASRMTGAIEIKTQTTANVSFGGGLTWP